MLPLAALAALSLLVPQPAAGMRCTDAPTVSCSDQMPHLNLSREDCIVEYYPSNSTECASLRLRGDGRRRRLGRLRLRPLLWTDDEGTPVAALDVSLLAARWTRLVLRFSALDGGAPPAGSVCRAVRLSEHALALLLPEHAAGRSPRLHWACPWCGHGCEARAFSLEYAASDARGHLPPEYGRFLFTVPPHTYVGEPGVPFPYVEVSSLPRVQLHWAPPPDGDTSLYSITTLVDGRRVAAQTVPVAQQSLEVEVGAAVGAAGGAISFSVHALLPNCSLCTGVRTPPVALERSADAPYLWVMAAVAAVAVAILLLGRFLWRAAGQNASPNKEAAAAPRVLLLYRAVSVGHVATVRRLATYLRAGGCHVLLDEDDVPRCKHKDPVSWYSSQMLEADVALVVASPCAPSPCAPAMGVYGAAAAVAESLLGARLARRGRCEALWLPGRGRCRCRPHLPPPARGLRLLRARRPRDLRRLLRRLHAGRPPPRPGPGDAAARQLLQMARESAGCGPCHHQEPTEVAADEWSDVPETPEPDLETEPPESLVMSPPVAAASSMLDLQSMNLLGPDHPAEDTPEEDDDGLLKEIRVTTWSAGGPITTSLQL